ncbi:MAG: hypothetical protein C0394_11345 [Syntrophus sp. (in: bacteria)]|nr:hypothetical protein [Syntrophus sp. (in: bacteria)]
MLAAVEDFMQRQSENDPLLARKNRIILFMNGGDGPCRLGQYLQVFKLAFFRIFGSPLVSSSGGRSTFNIRFLENLSSSVPGRTTSPPRWNPGPASWATRP